MDKLQYEASHVEISFRDQYLTRADMWRLSTGLLANSCPYVSQKLTFINSIRASVGNVYLRGEKVRAAYFSPKTIPIFRSESAKYVIFIQMSREMWHFDTDDGGDGDGDGDLLGGGTGGVGGEIMFNKLINAFLPELFKRWRAREAHHLVSIVLFTRIVYEHGERVGVACGGRDGKETDEFLGTPGGIELGEGRRYRDFFRVVISGVGSVDWTQILHKLKHEFAIFLRDVLLQPVPDDYEDPMGMEDPTPPPSSDVSIISRPGTPAMLPADTKRRPKPHILPELVRTEPKVIITGRPSAAIHGNVLEAINLATIQFSRGYIDRDLTRTGVSIMLVTAGAGHFEVDYEMLKATTEGLIANGMAVDLVCLSKVPLHTTPLMRYRNPAVASDNGNSEYSIPGLSPPKHIPNERNVAAGEWVYSVPHWIDISFWSASSEKKTRRNRVNGAKVHKQKNLKLVKKKSQVFRARCKMYELQMMGIMENEVACITVPFLHDNPLWRPLFDEPPANHLEILSKETERRKKEAMKDRCAWMDEYDDLTFKSLPVLQETLRWAELRRSGKEEADKKTQKILEEEDEMVLGTSFRADSTRGHSLTRSGFFERKMKERRPELESPIEPIIESPQVDQRPATPTTPTPRQGAVSVENPPGSATSTVSAGSGATLFGKPPQAALRLARHISSGFGLRPWGTAKAAPKAAATSEVSGIGMMTSGVGPGGVMVTRGFDTGESPKSPLSPKTRKADESPEKAVRSHPISIAGKNGGPMALEGTTRGRRRNFSGSPLDGRGMRDFEVLKAASSLSRPTGSRNDHLANAEKSASLPLTVSPTSALAPWVQVMNPSNPNKNDSSPVNQYRRWHHVFPRPVRPGTVKWKSLCTPAALPLTTEHFPTAEQLKTEYRESPYVISQNEDNELNAGNREELVRAMIALRLTQGFQIVVGEKVAEATQGRGGQAGIYDKNYMTRAGDFCFMSRGSQIHQLICDEEYNVEVKRYVRKPMTAITSRLPGSSDVYTSYIKTVLKENYSPVAASFQQPVSEYNWNYADQYVGGYEESMREQLRYWRARFVLIPRDPPESARRGGPGTELNDEEIRIEGIRRLTNTFQRNRYFPGAAAEEASTKPKFKETNPLQILYKTVDLSVVVAQELDSLFLPPDAEGNTRRSQLMTPAERFTQANIDLKTLAAEIQGPKGVKLQDRRWHLKTHTNCFIGEDMVTWLLENFSDIELRADAEALGKQLYTMGLFHHVDKRHDFRDGNFFYRLTDTYARPSSKAGPGWFGTTFKSTPANAENSAPGTPAMESHPSPRSRASTISAATQGPMSPVQTKKLDIHLSLSMVYDVDPSHHSYRKELITLHYDRLHNPDNCYHIRIDWMTTTAKLIEDQLVSWARTVDRYGLKLVEAPIDEVVKMSSTNCFRSPITIPLAYPAPKENTAQYYKALMKYFNFVLDIEAGSCFPQGEEEDVRVRYSWGVNNYTYNQYIHRSGVMFAQINDEGQILLMGNRAYTMRVGKGKEWGVGMTAGAINDERPEDIKAEIGEKARDAEWLKMFWEEVVIVGRKMSCASDGTEKGVPWAHGLGIEVDMPRRERQTSVASGASGLEGFALPR